MDSDRRPTLPHSSVESAWFDPANYGPECESLLNSAPLNELGPGSPNTRRQTDLETLTPESIAFARPIRDREMIACCHSALWLLHDHLDRSHRLSQEIETPSGSYWHGIMHRREPDFPNAKYWFRQVGDHAIFPLLAEDARAVAIRQTEPIPATARFLAEQTRWDPMRFIDLCEMSYRRRTSCESLCREIAWLEWRRLFDHCYRLGTG